MSNATFPQPTNGIVDVYNGTACSSFSESVSLSILPDICISLPSSNVRTSFASTPRCANGTVPLYAPFGGTNCTGGVLNQLANPFPEQFLGQCSNSGLGSFLFWCDGAPGLSLDPKPPVAPTPTTKASFPAPTKVPDDARIRFLQANASCFAPGAPDPYSRGEEEMVRLGTSGSCLAVGTRRWVFEASAVCDDGRWADLYAYEDMSCDKLWWSFSQDQTADTLGMCGEVSYSVPIRGLKMVCEVPSGSSSNIGGSSPDLGMPLGLGVGLGVPLLVIAVLVSIFGWRRWKRGEGKGKGKVKAVEPKVESG